MQNFNFFLLVHIGVTYMNEIDMAQTKKSYVYIYIC